MAAAILNNENSYEISMDVRNDGAVPNLPADAIVEVPGMISAAGITPLRLPPLPEPLAQLMERQFAVQELAVEAAVTGNRETALQALILDPVVDSVASAATVLDQLLEAHRDIVSPRFFE
jgi:alpha-galactosidase/6-phospho-beta-glucosidase family protein